MCIVCMPGTHKNIRCSRTGVGDICEPLPGTGKPGPLQQWPVLLTPSLLSSPVVLHFPDSSSSCGEELQPLNYFHCYFITTIAPVMNHNVNIWYATPVKGLFAPPKERRTVETPCSRSLGTMQMHASHSCCEDRQQVRST